ncbi:MAG: hypothetical protein AW11_01759 [Candidatus Accumulibacter regalis]|jgi:hypothetical protein|uniref:Uncharacterized protein n=1 Tax=Accumulibacter regalis TaxID=522306 RepID=A0A011QJB8_ACCRE|nr:MULTISPECIES: hypothetical protein [unclassified Candidatus Accumulibacter]EXI89125.1 MAG: hypothetical protein AW11_01759 [Candidatus Accumulibacter regalis]MQM35243.1 hypothetical protein [Candidatus Accumulibacter phosphatis]MBL8367514.1 hypothetical protein [Accumulibacter sp.]HRE71957.1 hypothetical protein [Accumulibacter sp.]HRE86187.1 hypothetical protein [Accumulibacter sp.]
MSRLRPVAIFVIATAIVVLGSEVGEQLAIPGIHSVVPSAEAVVGRPLTPVSYAGVARRTVRRCAAGVYRC